MSAVDAENAGGAGDIANAGHAGGAENAADAGNAGVAVLILAGDPQETEATVASVSAVLATSDEVHVCTTWREGAGLAQADYALLMRPEDRLEIGGLRAVERFARARAADVVTCDRIEAGNLRRCQRFSARLLEQFPYVGRGLLVRTGLLKQVMRSGGMVISEWDLQLRLVGAAQVVEHCPVVAINQASPLATGSLADRIATVRLHLARSGRTGQEVRCGSTGQPRIAARPGDERRVSIVVPTAFSTRDLGGEHPHVLAEALLAALSETTAEVDCEIILVVDEAADPQRIEACRQRWPGSLRVTYTSGDFNFSHAINTGVAAATGEVVLLLNDDVEPLRPGWIQDLLATLELPGVGVVGARLLFEDSRIQHMGVVCPPGRLPMHPGVFEVDQPNDPMAQADVEYLAVTGACLMYRRADHEVVGGWNEDLPLNFNDVDFCLRLASRGAAVVCVNSVRLLHRESSTRTAQILDAETAQLAQWAQVVALDPHIEYWG